MGDDEPKQAGLNFAERWLAGELSKLGQELCTYAVRMLGESSEQGEAGQPSADEEARMGSRLEEWGRVMIARAMERISKRDKAIEES